MVLFLLGLLHRASLRVLDRWLNDYSSKRLFLSKPNRRLPERLDSDSTLTVTHLGYGLCLRFRTIDDGCLLGQNHRPMFVGIHTQLRGHTCIPCCATLLWTGTYVDDVMDSSPAHLLLPDLTMTRALSPAPPSFSLCGRPWASLRSYVI